MDRYQIGAPGDEQFEPGSNNSVLRNKIGEYDLGRIELLEANLLAAAQRASYRQIQTDTCFSVLYIRGLHKSWLGILYPFAGEIRTIDISKGFVTFAPVAFMPATLVALDEVLKANTPCEGMSVDELVHAIAKVHGELVFVHPFRKEMEGYQGG